MEEQKPYSNDSNHYWNKLFNRVERALGWFFFVTGALILVAFYLYQLIIALFKDTELNIFVKFGIFLVVIGFVILIFSVIREKVTIAGKDKYRRVKQ